MSTKYSYKRLSKDEAALLFESGILFIGPKENESEYGQRRREFFGDWKLLEQWDRTFAWGNYGSLMQSRSRSVRECMLLSGSRKIRKSGYQTCCHFSVAGSMQMEKSFINTQHQEQSG